VYYIAGIERKSDHPMFSPFAQDDSFIHAGGPPLLRSMHCATTRVSHPAHCIPCSFFGGTCESLGMTVADSRLGSSTQPSGRKSLLDSSKAEADRPAAECFHGNNVRSSL